MLVLLLNTALATVVYFGIYLENITAISPAVSRLRVGVLPARLIGSSRTASAALSRARRKAICFRMVWTPTSGPGCQGSSLGLISRIVGSIAAV